MIHPLNIPRGVGNIFKLCNCFELLCRQEWTHRPDQLINDMAPMPSMKLEILDNYVSNISPISLKTGSAYTMVDNMFKEYFYNG